MAGCGEEDAWVEGKTRAGAGTWTATGAWTEGGASVGGEEGDIIGTSVDGISWAVRAWSDTTVASCSSEGFFWSHGRFFLP